MQATGKNIFILNEGANTEEALNGWFDFTL